MKIFTERMADTSNLHKGHYLLGDTLDQGSSPGSDSVKPRFFTGCLAFEFDPMRGVLETQRSTEELIADHIDAFLQVPDFHGRIPTGVWGSKATATLCAQPGVAGFTYVQRSGFLGKSYSTIKVSLIGKLAKATTQDAIHAILEELQMVLTGKSAPEQGQAWII